MKKMTFFLFVLLTIILTSCAEDEPEWKASEVCPEAGMNRYGMPNRGTFVDERDGRVYKYTTVGDQVWMAENLKYNAPYSKCDVGESALEIYCDLVEHNCDTRDCCVKSWCELFGRYYTLIENGEERGFIDRNLADSICPKGWHVPTKNEWEILDDAMKVEDEDGYDVTKRLSASDSNIFKISENDVNHYNENRVGTDDCGMSFLPAGSWSSMRFEQFGMVFWSSTQYSETSSWMYHVILFTKFMKGGDKSSIRCIMD